MAKSKAEIQAEIAEYEAILDNASVPQDEKDFAKSEIADLKEQLEKMGKQTAGTIHVVRPTPDTDSGSTGKGKKAKKAKEPKKKEPKEPKKRSHKASDKTATPSCDELLKAYEERRAAAKANNRKKKSRSVFSIIADKVEGAVIKAFKSVPKDDIKNDPKGTFKDFDKLEAAATAFLQAFKELLGDEYESKEVKGMESGIQKLINDMRKKYAK